MQLKKVSKFITAATYLLSSLSLAESLTSKSQAAGNNLPIPTSMTFGKCLKDEAKGYNQLMSDFSVIAKLKFELQMMHIEELKAGESYATYVKTILALTPLSNQLIKLVDLEKKLLKSNSLESSFSDETFQDFSSSNNFQFVDLIASGKFTDKNFNKNKKYDKLLTALNTDSIETAELRSEWENLISLLNDKSLKMHLFDLSRLASNFGIEVSLIDINLNHQLAQYGNSLLQSKLSLEEINSETPVKNIPFDHAQFKFNAKNNEYDNRFAMLAMLYVKQQFNEHFLKGSVKRDTFDKYVNAKENFSKIQSVINALVASKKIKPVNKSKTLDVNQFKKSTTLDVNQLDQLFAFINEAEKVRKNAFDEFMLVRGWFKNVPGIGAEANSNVDIGAIINTKRLVNVNGKQMNLSLNEMAAADGMARTLVGESLSCQQGGAKQFEAIGLVFANRAKSIEDYLNLNERIKLRLDQDENFFTSQMTSLFDDSDKTNQIKTSRNPLRGMSDYGRRFESDRIGKLLHPVSQAISAPRQFDTWQAATTEVLVTTMFTKNRALIPNIPVMPFNIPKPKTSAEHGVFSTVLCPNGANDFSADNTSYYNQALAIALKVVTDVDGFRDQYKFISNAKSENVFFYTHGISLGFVNRVNATQIYDSVARTRLNVTRPNSAKGGTLPGACSKIMFFQPKPGSLYYQNELSKQYDF